MRNKVPAVTLAFWVIKIAATTVGETGGDALSMTLNLGYLVSTAIFFAIFVVLLAGQVAAKKFHPFLYWAVIVATTTTGTTISDYLDRTAGLGYPLASLLLFTGVLASLALWSFTTGSVSVERIDTRRAEIFYWVTILISNTLGTALGDFTADSMRSGFEGGALIFAGLLAILAAAYFWTNISRTLLFWTAFILTRPLGATLGDILTKPVSHGGLNLDRITSSLVIAVFIIVCIFLLGRRAEQEPDTAAT
ncbi:MAG TPA: hypothetical protein VH000_10635 [Rhizomicrobium sp.]|jgi:uncharacterized membrane-anchored protein|nr:hypothetical protein [Rhizomicrobium sp.]HEX4534678.1 hypothetical protein [Rhizomicrobium sp.]